MDIKLSVEDQIRLLELGIETQILTNEELVRLRVLGILTPGDDTNSELDNDK
jgi:hypothetical protein